MFTPLAQFEIYMIGNLSVLNYFILYWNNLNVVVFSLLGFFFGMFYILMDELKIIPNKIQYVLENIYLFVYWLVYHKVGKKGLKFFPILFTIFATIILLNIMGSTLYNYILIIYFIGVLIFFLIKKKKLNLKKEKNYNNVKKKYIYNKKILNLNKVNKRNYYKNNIVYGKTCDISKTILGMFNFWSGSGSGGDDPFNNHNYKQNRSHEYERPLLKKNKDNYIFNIKDKGSIKNANYPKFFNKEQNLILGSSASHPIIVGSDKIFILTGNKTASDLKTIDNDGNIINSKIYCLANYLNYLKSLDVNILNKIFKCLQIMFKLKKEKDFNSMEINRLNKLIKSSKSEGKEINPNIYKDLIKLEEKNEFYIVVYDSIIFKFNEIIYDLLFSLNLQSEIVDIFELKNIILWSLSSRFTIRDTSNNDDIVYKFIMDPENQTFFKKNTIFNFTEKENIIKYSNSEGSISVDLFSQLFYFDKMKSQSDDFDITLYNNINLYEEYKKYQEYEYQDSDCFIYTEFIEYIKNKFIEL